jgi:hypothetical protein
MRGGTAKQGQSPSQWPAGAKATPDEVGQGRQVQGELLDWASELVNRSLKAVLSVTRKRKT